MKTSNIFLKSFPETVDIDGVFYKINSDFRVGIQFDQLIHDSHKSSEVKIFEMLHLYYPVIPDNIAQAIEEILKFYSCGEEDNDSSVLKANELPHNRLFSYLEDDTLIYVSFLNEYQIDLISVENLHWWKFKYLFLHLSDDSQMKKVMSYRAIKINQKMPKEQRQFYLKMKRMYRLSQDNNTDKAVQFAGVLGKGIMINRR